MYHYYVESVSRVVDGDTIDVVFDLGFNMFKKERVRLAGIDTPEKRTRNAEEKVLGIDATNWLIARLEDTTSRLIIRTERDKQSGKYGRTLGWLWLESDETSVSLNEQMIEGGYAWPYDGGKKQKNLEELRVIRREKGTLG